MVTTLPKPTETQEPEAPQRPEMLPSEVLEQDGWCQHFFADDKGRKCALGAVGSALELLVPSGPSPSMDVRRLPPVINAVLLDVLQETTGEEIRHGIYDVPAWNNRPERRADEVVALWVEAEKRLGWRK